MVLGRDIASRIQISIEMIPTLPTNEHALRTAVVAGDMPTAIAHLRSMPGVNPDHCTAAFLGLVLNKAAKLGERPGVHPALGLGASFGLHSFADIFEVFQHNRRAWLGSPYDLLTEHMIGVP